MFDRGVGFTRRHMHPFGEKLEVVNQLFHVLLHVDPRGWRNLVVVDDEDAEEDEDAVEEDADDEVDEEEDEDDRESEGLSSIPPPPLFPPRSSPAGSSAPLRLRMTSARLDSRIMGYLFWKNLPFQSCRFRARPKASDFPPFSGVSEGCRSITG